MSDLERLSEKGDQAIERLIDRFGGAGLDARTRGLVILAAEGWFFRDPLVYEDSARKAEAAVREAVRLVKELVDG